MNGTQRAFLSILSTFIIAATSLAVILSPGVAANTLVVNSVIGTFEVGMLTPSGAPIEEGATVPLTNVTVAGTTDPLANVSMTTRAGNYSVTANATGSFQIPRVELLEGLNVLTVTATNSTNVSASALLIVTSDTVCELEVDQSPNATNSPSVRISGSTEYGASVEVNGALVQVSKSGSWSLNLTLTEGINDLNVNATDPVGNSAHYEMEVTLDTTPPAVSVFSPMSGSQTSQSVVTISGTAEAGSVVLVNGVIAYAVLPTNRTALWTATIALFNGTNQITVKATDALGNTAFSNLTLVYSPADTISHDEMRKALDDLNVSLRQSINDAEDFASLVMFIAIILFLIAVLFAGAVWYVLGGRVKDVAAQSEEQSLEEIEQEEPKDVEQEFQDLEQEIRRDETR